MLLKLVDKNGEQIVTISSSYIKPRCTLISVHGINQCHMTREEAANTVFTLTAAKSESRVCLWGHVIVIKQCGC